MKTNRIPIAMFHHVSNRKDWDSLRPFVVLQETLTLFLDTIEHHGRRPVTFQDLCSPSFIPSKRDVIITFDDCGKHLLDFAVPELIKRNIRATFYIPTAHIGGVNQWNMDKGQSKVELMTEGDLIALDHAGMEIGGHSNEHIHLGRLTSKEAQNQVSECQAILTRLTGKKTVSFAYPFGSIVKNPQDSLEAAGFKFACSIFSKENTNFQLRRFIIHDGDDARSMRLKLSMAYRVYRSISDPRKNESAWG